MSKPVTYAQSGVDIDANDVMVERIRSYLGSTYGPRVIDVPWGFAGLVAPWSAGFIFDHFAGYQPALLIAAAVALLSAISAAIFRLGKST